MKILFVYEFGFRSDDAMMPDLVAAVERQTEGLRWRYCKGFLQRYRPGGHQPLRVLNLVFVYLRLIVETLVFRPDIILVRTTPPGVQLLATLLGKIFGIGVICWLMDYHPEIEARMAEKKGLAGLARSLRLIDAVALRSMVGIVVLDRAMADLCRARAPRTPVIIHPTWNRGADAFVPMKCVLEPGVIHLAYAGNLGAAHDTSSLTSLLTRLNALVPVRLTVIGAPVSGQKRFKDMAAATGIELECMERIPFKDLGATFERLGVEMGIVLMTDESAGLVSPSKFSGYITYGRPVLYVGPAGTNAEDIATVFGAGLALPNQASAARLDDAARALADPASRRRWAEQVETASRHFASLDGNSLASALRPIFDCAWGKKVAQNIV